jgi:hypothetical protein
MLMAMKEENVRHRSVINSQLAELQTKLLVKEKQTQELTATLVAQTKELSNATAEITNLRRTLAENTTQRSVDKWRNFRSDPTKTLVIGSSIIRDISPSQLQDTDVMSISGGHINEVAAEISKTPADKYNHVVLVVGGNDCDPRELTTQVSPSNIVEEYKDLVKICKTKTQSVSVSSICPRTTTVHARNQIDSVNAGLQVMCGEENVNFVDNTQCFYLKDNSVNDAYLLADGVHLNYKGTNKLAQNLCLKLKDGQTSVCVTRKRNLGPKRPFYLRSGETYENDNFEYSHQFWKRAHQKANSSEKYETYSRSSDDAGVRNVRCYFCYETNHTKRTCRHEKPVVCNTCGAEGHKSKHH